MNSKRIGQQNVFQIARNVNEKRMLNVDVMRYEKM